MFSKANKSGLLKYAVKESFDESSQNIVLQRAQSILDGNSNIDIKWAKFSDTAIKGAYVSSDDTILLSKSLKGILISSI